MATNQVGDQSWAEDLVTRVGLAAKQIRGRRSARWLSEETERLGYRISPQVIARLDTGRRGDHLEVAELLVLARALGVAPGQLLYPDLPDGTVDALPGTPMSAMEALRWISGETPPRGANTPIDRPASELMRLSRQLEDTRHRSVAVSQRLAVAEYDQQKHREQEPDATADDSMLRSLGSVIVATHHQLAQLHEEEQRITQRIAELKDGPDQ